MTFEIHQNITSTIAASCPWKPCHEEQVELGECGKVMQTREATEGYVNRKHLAKLVEL